MSLRKLVGVAAVGLSLAGCNIRSGGSDLKEIKETIKQIQDQQKEILAKVNL